LGVSPEPGPIPLFYYYGAWNDIFHPVKLPTKEISSAQEQRGSNPQMHPI